VVLSLGATPALALEVAAPPPELVSGIVVSAEPRVVPETGVILTDIEVLGTVPSGKASVTSFAMRGGVVGNRGMWSEQFVDLSVGDTVIAGVAETDSGTAAVTTPIPTTFLSSAATSGTVLGSAGSLAGYRWGGIHWADSALPASYYVNPSGLPVGATAAIQAAAQTWEDDPGSYLDYNYGGSVGMAPGADDGVSVIGAGTPGPGWSSAVALCSYWYFPNTMEMAGFDIMYNTGSFSFATNGSTSAFDVQGVGTHELGHTLSLSDLDASDSGQVMYGYTSRGNLSQRTLKWGDIAGIRAIYPVPPPVAVSDSATVAEDTQLTVDAPGLLSNDFDLSGNSLAAHAVSLPAHGTLVLSSDGGYTYRPADDWNGTDSFTYRISNGVYYSAPAVVTIRVTPVNDAPISVDDTASIAVDTTLTARAPGVLRNDIHVDGDSLVASLTESAQNGTLTLSPDGAYQYVPNPHFSGTDTFAYRAFDGIVYSSPATVTITVSETNQAPIANPDSAVTAENTALVSAGPGILGNDYDPEGNFLSAVLVDSPLHGTLTLAPDGSYNYRPASDWFGIDTFTYRASDAATLSAPATVTITVNEYVAPPPAAIAIPGVSISAKTPARVKRGKAFYVTGSVSPVHASGTRVTLRFERYYRKRWRVVKRTSATVSPGSSSFRYRAKLSPRGSWRVIVSHSGDGVVDTGSASVTRRLRVR
jgi:VCBS repeat-containing protein